MGLRHGLQIDLYQAGFGTFRQEILDAGSGLYRYAPDVAIIAVEGEDWVPGVYRDFLRRQGGEQRSAVTAWRDEAEMLLRKLRSQSGAAVLIHNFAYPGHAIQGIADAKHGEGQHALIRSLNDALATLTTDVIDTHVVDYAALVNRHGSLNWYDNRMRHYARAPIAGSMQPFLAAEYIKFLRAFRG